MKNNTQIVDEVKRKFDDAMKYFDLPNKKDIKYNNLNKIDHMSIIQEERNEKLDKLEKAKLKQRMINFSLRLFDKVDLVKIINFWKSSFLLKLDSKNELRKKKEERKIRIKNKDSSTNDKNDENDGNNTNKDKNNKKEKTRKIENMEYEYREPEQDIRKIIPFCTNIFFIRKNET